MRQMKSLPLLVLVLVGLPGGCSTARQYRHLDDPPLVIRGVTATVPIAVDVRNFAGDVIIVVDEQATDVTVRVRREARHGSLRTEEAEAALALIHHSSEMVRNDRGPVLRVRVASSSPEWYFQRAHLQITAPAVSDVHVETTRGRVYATDLRGEVFITTTEGDVRVMSNFPLRQPVTVLNRDGDIDYRVRGNSGGRFECEAVGGTISPRMKLGRFVFQPGSRQDLLIGTLNDGENVVQLKTVDANIRIAVVEQPTAVGYLIR
ncbi:MAG: hypothetical protein KDA25_12670 [Phycisphaerales bacterium]|nr:hypothetical protein [Phycisphaerales bacterium]